MLNSQKEMGEEHYQPQIESVVTDTDNNNNNNTSSVVLPYCWGTTPEEEYYKEKGIKSSKSFYTSPRGQTLFTRSWEPLSPLPPRGIVCMVHGYGNDISWSFQATPIFLAQKGFACFALDLPGHGQSEGLKAYVPNLDHVIDDCISFFSFIQNLPQFQFLPFFLFGESMGGAICLLIHFRFRNNNHNAPHPNNGFLNFKGAILIAPMCRISDKVKPRWPIPEILTLLGKFLPTLAIVPNPDILDKSIKVAEKKEIAVMNPSRYKGKPRLGTVIELLRATEYLSAKLKEVTIPFIVLHGSSDLVTDPDVSRALHEEANSKDKTIKIYDGMLHSLLFGEPDHNVELVRNDIVAWLTQRCKQSETETETDTQSQ